MLLAQGVPKFSGAEGDFRDYSREFPEYLNNLNAATPGGLTDTLCLTVLASSLDERSQRHLKTQRELRPDLTYAEYWGELCKVYGLGTEDRRKREWDSIGLDLAGGDLGLLALTVFQSDIAAAVVRDPHILEEEIERKILQELPRRPFNWHEKVVSKIADRRQGRHWVKITKPCPLDKQALSALFGALLGHAEVQLEERRLEFLINCRDEIGLDRALGAHGMGGGLVHNKDSAEADVAGNF